MFDLAVKEFKEQLLELSNNSGLPATIIFYVFKEFTDVAHESMNQQIENQKKQRDTDQDPEDKPT